MARRKEREPEPLEVTARDFAMARLAAARACANSTISAIDEALALFVDCEDDEDGTERADLIDSALDSAGGCARALECASEAMPAIDPEECEPWDEDGDEVDDDPAPSDIPRARVIRGKT